MTNINTGSSVLRQLRSLIPGQPATTRERLLIAEAQAALLRACLNVGAGRFPTERLASLPRLAIEQRELPTSGVAYWNGKRWIIAVNKLEPMVRQRFSMIHELKHLIDHGSVASLYGADTETQRARAEDCADYFAGCVLMPRNQLLRRWAAGADVAALAAHFDVSERAIEVRLAQLGIGQNRERCARPTVSRGGTQQFTIVVRKAVA